ncbi:uncharacterized protein LOC135142774 [Zophobas morio]|uniref:uncharacterized protein LOC135142774 n=1 Tax=Zophobas morio TaxID=2755281 RepID=UPI003082C238
MFGALCQNPDWDKPVISLMALIYIGLGGYLLGLGIQHTHDSEPPVSLISIRPTPYMIMSPFLIATGVILLLSVLTRNRKIFNGYIIFGTIAFVGVIIFIIYESVSGYFGAYLLLILVAVHIYICIHYRSVLKKDQLE